MDKTRVTEIGGRSLSADWEQADQFTHRLVNPDDPQMSIPRCHGHWPGRLAPIPIATVFDVGIGSPDWRVRVRKAGHYRAYGCFADLPTAKRFVAEQVAKGSGARRRPEVIVPSSGLTAESSLAA